MKRSGPRQNEKLRDDTGRAKRDLPRPKFERTAASAHLIYGVLPVLEALRGNAHRIDKVYVADGAREHRLREISELARKNGIAVSLISRDNMSSMVPAEANHQGVVAAASAAEYTSETELLESAGDGALFVILDGIEDPRNFGAILRTVECAGADGVFIPERRAVGLTETAAKSSAGATEYVKVAKVPNVNRLIEELKTRNVWVVGTSGDAALDYTDWDWSQNSALVLGNEGSGLHRLVAENCDVLVRIPMYGRIDSLNVSVAAGVILFEARRQRAAKAEHALE